MVLVDSMVDRFAFVLFRKAKGIDITNVSDDVIYKMLRHEVDTVLAPLNRQIEKDLMLPTGLRGPLQRKKQTVAVTTPAAVEHDDDEAAATTTTTTSSIKKSKSGAGLFSTLYTGSNSSLSNNSTVLAKIIETRLFFHQHKPILWPFWWCW